MTAEPDISRLQRQVGDAAKRLHRTTDCSALVVAVADLGEGNRGVAYTVHGLTDAEQELAILAVLTQLANELQPGAAEGCPDCTAAWSRVSAAAAALRPAFVNLDGHAHGKGRC